MRQASLFDHCAPLASAMPAIKAAMRAVAGAPEGEGRKALPDRINAVASASGVRLTAGNARSISKDTLDKWLTPTATSRMSCRSANWMTWRLTFPMTGRWTA